LDKLNDRVIDSNGQIFKESLKDVKVQDIAKYITDKNYYYFYGLIYYNNFGLDKWSSYFFIQAISTDNLFKKEAFNSLLKIYIKEKNWENLRLLFINYGDFIDEQYLYTVRWFIDGIKPENFLNFPQDIDFLNIIEYIIEVNEEYFKKNEESYLKNYLYSLLFKNTDNENFKNFVAKIVTIKEDPIFKLIYSFLINDKKEFKDNLKSSLSSASSYEDFDNIREMAIKLNCKKYLFKELDDIYKKSIYAEYFYVIDNLRYGNNNGTLLCKEFLKKINQYKNDPFYNEMDYNIRQIILNKEVSFNEK